MWERGRLRKWVAYFWRALGRVGGFSGEGRGGLFGAVE